jgi:hypothetical protein
MVRRIDTHTDRRSIIPGHPLPQHPNDPIKSRWINPGLTMKTGQLKGVGPLKSMAEWTGLEPATPGVTGRYSNQLNYHSAWSTTLGDCPKCCRYLRQLAVKQSGDP